MSQTCATCLFGSAFGVGRGNCYWPYYADGDGETHDALFDPMPPWAERMIEGNSGERVSDRFDCSGCPTFEQREVTEPKENPRCPNTADMFQESASDKAARVLGIPTFSQDQGERQNQDSGTLNTNGESNDD